MANKESNRRTNEEMGASSGQPKEIKSLYMDTFDPQGYQNTFYSALDDEIAFFIRNFHEAFKDPLLLSLPVSNRRVCEFGTGPVPLYSASASAFSSHISFAEFLPQNREALLRWLKGNSGTALDWSIFFKFISQLEKSVSSAEEIADRVRKMWHLVLPCDAGFENPLQPVSGRFDVVSMCLCLEFAADNFNTYKKMVANVATMIDEGGFLLMAGALGNTSYNLGGVSFPAIPLTPEKLTTAVTAAGMKVVRINELPRTTGPEKAADHTGVYFIIAMKPKKD